MGLSSFREEKIEVVIFGWDFAVILNDTLSALSKYVPHKKNPHEVQVAKEMYFYVCVIKI